MRQFFFPLIFLIHTPLQIANLAVWASLVIIFGVAKLLLPFPILQQRLASAMHFFMFCFGKTSVLLIRCFNSVQFEFRVQGALSKKSWYLILANHMSYLDIILLIDFAAERIPVPKFFLKQELIWLPFVGLGAWALDMPFMRRYSREYLEKFPHKKGMDIQTTKRFCQKFKLTPTTVINFVEGTRYTAVKHKVRGSQYKHLLPPKAGGIAFTLATMGELFTNILDISLLYPDNQRHPMLSMLSGQLSRVVMDVNVLDVPAESRGDYYIDEQFRGQFHTWLNGLWAAKDARIAQWMEQKT
ncbi:acyltransferase [Alteromonas pelagimontana]|uniref:Acyltransferase n=2 Tax=Alteromonas pelagimontana TaxID=1858656 RepID=A0A6M4MES0_9ALTE|nr:acyltransferase [Alteromonas pelagimontana]QJR81602.1 acyltransferase [Alteromonas pelagimontana]